MKVDYFPKVKAFGEWFDNITVKPKSAYKTRKDTRFGPFFLRLGTFEVIRKIVHYQMNSMQPSTVSVISLVE